MSEKEQAAKDIEKSTLKVTWIKAGSVIFMAISISLSIGFVGGNLSAWMKHTDDRLNTIENNVKSCQNEVRNLYNHTILPK